MKPNNDSHTYTHTRTHTHAHTQNTHTHTYEHALPHNACTHFEFVLKNGLVLEFWPFIVNIYCGSSAQFINTHHFSLDSTLIE